MPPELDLIEDPDTDTVVEDPKEPAKDEKPDRGDVVAEPKADEPKKEDPPAEPEEPAEEPAAKAKKQGSDHVPIGRFNEVNEQKKALERELAELKAAKAPATPSKEEPKEPAFDLRAQEKAYAEAMMEGDADKAVQIRDQINEHIEKRALEKAVATVRGELTAKQIASDLETASAQAVKDFPYLNTDAGEEALELIIASRDRRIAQGVPAGDALRQAVAAIAPKFAPAEDAKPEPNKAKDERPAAALARGAAASTAQPPAVQAGVGNRATAAKVNVADLDDEQFAALSPAEKKKLRGD